ncbi:transglutaminaseTgpA domain-containing protein [Cryobacterium frigoriphilum]|nr:DUF3488 and transglutaminase-like domain-containing protein [Cryobacterium frigoriphilum]
MPDPSVPHEPSLSHAGRTEPRRRTEARSAEWPLMLVLLVLLLTGFSGLAPVLRGSAWWWVIALMAVVTLAALAGLRRIGVPRVLVPFAGLGVLVMLLTLLFGAGTGLLWLIPTPATIGVLTTLAEQGASSISEQTTPAVLTEGITLLLAAGAGVLAWLVHLIAVTLRVPAVAGLAVLIPVLIPGLVLSEGVGTLPLLLVAAAYLWLLRIDVRLGHGREERASMRLRAVASQSHASQSHASGSWVSGPWGGPGSGGGSLLLGGVTLVGALTLSLVVPTVATSGAGGGAGSLFGAGVSPMVDLGQDLRRPEAGPALHYVTTAENRPYLTLLTLDTFEGTTWTSDDDVIDQTNTVDAIDRPAGLGDDVETVEFSSSIVIDGVRSPLLPLPMPATRVNGLTGNWYWNSETLTVKGQNASTQGQTYTVSGFEVVPTADQLRTSSREYPADAVANLELPEERPAIIDETARTVTADSASVYDSAVALQDYLNGADFRYDTEAPVEEGYDGGGLEVVGTFLEAKSGYCVHFSSAMAVMARALGIPARISIGYLPGTRNFSQGIETFEVDSHDLHAWPELYFVGVGWVPFEPTPGRGSVPDYAQVGVTPAPSRTPGATDAAQTPRPEGVVPTDAGTDPGQAAAGDEVLTAIVFWPGTMLLVVSMLLLVPGLLRGWRRRGRLRRIRSGAGANIDGVNVGRGTGQGQRGGAAEAWAELTDTALDLGVRVSRTDTPREVAARLEARLDASADRDALNRDALNRVLGDLERLRFAQPGAAPLRGAGALADDVDRVVRALFAASDRAVRLRAALAPVSLLGAHSGAHSGARASERFADARGQGSTNA